MDGHRYPRIVLLFGALVYPAQYFTEPATRSPLDGLGARLAVGGLLALAWALSYSPRILRYWRGIFLACTCLLGGHVIYITWCAGYTVPYVAGLFIVLTSINACFRITKDFLGFNLSFFVASSLGLHYTANLPAAPVIAVGLLTVSVVEYLVLVVRVRTERQLELKQRELESVFSAFPAVYLWLDEQGKILEQRGDSRGYDAARELASLHGAEIQRALRESCAVSLERPLDGVGGERYFALRISPLEDGRVILAVLDRTEERANELERLRAYQSRERQSRLSALGRVVEGAAQATAGPLSIIEGRVEQLEECLESGSLVAATGSRLFQSIRESTARIERTMRALRALGGDSADEPLQPTPVGELLEAVALLFREKCLRYGVELTVQNLASDSYVICRAGQARLILNDLVANALDATRISSVQKTGRWIRLEARDTGAWIEVEISDGGPGIPEAQHERVFEPFFTTKPVGEGTGLGLSTARQLLAEQGGRIVLEKGSPTRFVVQLPGAERVSVPPSAPFRSAA